MTTVLTYDYEASEGAIEGSVIPRNAHDVVATSGTPRWSAAGAIHGSFGWLSDNVVNGGRLTYLNSNTIATTGSIYLNWVFNNGTDTATVIGWRGDSGGLKASVQLRTAKSISINDDSSGGTTKAVSTLKILLGSPIRLDWQQTYNVTTGQITITVRIFSNDNFEGTTASETITATFTNPSPTRVSIGPASPGNKLYFDSLRLYNDVSAWPAPIAPPVSAERIYGFDSTTGNSEAAEAVVVTSGHDGVVDKHGTMTYGADAALHGSFGVILEEILNGGRLVYSGGNVAASTGSLYFYVNDRQVDSDGKGNAEFTLLSFRDSSGNSVASMVLGSKGSMQIHDPTDHSVASSSFDTNMQEWMRLDWQKTYSGGNITVTFKLFTGNQVEWIYSSDTITATFACASPTNFELGQGKSSVNVYYDTLRQWDDVAAWPDPYAPADPGGGPPNAVSYIWVGDPSADGFVVSAKTNSLTAVKLGYGFNSTMIGASFTDSVFPDTDGFVKLVVTGQQPNSKYYYQLWDTPEGQAGAFVGDIGQARTTPVIGLPASFNAAFGSCVQGKEVSNAAFTDILTFDPVFFAHLGDFHYKGIDSDDPARHAAGFVDQIAQHPVLKQLLAEVPINYILSDHEYSGNNGDSFENTAIIAFHIAYAQSVPYRSIASQEEVPDGLYRSWVIGRVRFIMIDCRSTLRSPGQPADPMDGSKTYLGAKQLIWFKSELLQPEPLKVILSDTCWQIAPFGPNNDGTDVDGNYIDVFQDKWMAYPYERNLVGQFIVDNNVNVDFWGGDTHLVGVDHTHNTFGFPVLNSSPLDQKGWYKNFDEKFDQAYAYQDFKGGDKSQWGDKDPPCSQYLRIQFVDNGETITRVATSWDQQGGLGRMQQSVSWDAPFEHVDFRNNVLMRWDGNLVTDHNRDPIDIQFNRLENSQRVASGTLRKYTVAKKRTFSVSWNDVPHSNSAAGLGTVDGALAGKDIRDFYVNNDQPFQLDLYYGDGTFESYQVTFDAFDYKVNSRGNVDLWSADLTMLEV